MFRYPYQMHECPVCGRPLEVRDDYAGREVICPHCRGRFVVCRSTNRSTGTPPDAKSLLGRADRLLRISARQLWVARRTNAQPTM
jgi:DNA-directed RNA polymerase subunit RPC12/RpoP